MKAAIYIISTPIVYQNGDTPVAITTLLCNPVSESWFGKTAVIDLDPSNPGGELEITFTHKMELETQGQIDFMKAVFKNYPGFWIQNGL